MYINILTCNTFIAITYIELPDQLKHPVKGFVNVKNNDNKCFFGAMLDI